MFCRLQVKKSKKVTLVRTFNVIFFFLLGTKLFLSAINRDYVIHKERGCVQDMGECTQVFWFPQALQAPPKTRSRKTIGFLPLWKSSGHFDMLIHSFQTAGICTCINSNILLLHKHVKLGPQWRGSGRNCSFWSPMEGCISLFLTHSWKLSIFCTNRRPFAVELSVTWTCRKSTW